MFEGDVQSRQVPVAVPREERAVSRRVFEGRVPVLAAVPPTMGSFDQGDLLAEVRRLRTPFSPAGPDR